MTKGTASGVGPITTIDLLHEFSRQYSEAALRLSLEDVSSLICRGSNSLRVSLYGYHRHPS